MIGYRDSQIQELIIGKNREKGNLIQEFAQVTLEWSLESVFMIEEIEIEPERMEPLSRESVFF